MGQFGIGQSVSRLEDPRLLTGRGNYLDDKKIEGVLRGYVLRSPHAHAKIVSIDTSEAQQAPGVHLVLTGKDFEASGLGSQTPRIPRKRPNGEDFFVSPQPALVSDTTKFAGDYVAFIVADTIEQALDASELVYVDYAPLPSVMDTAIASDNESPAVWEGCPDNISFLHELGPREATDAAIDGAHRVVKQRFVINRIACCSMEVRSCVGLLSGR